MQPVSQDVVDMLEAYGDSSGFALNLKFADNLHISKEPATPIICVTVYDTSGYATDLSLDAQGMERPSIQIRIRGKKYLDAMNLAQEIKNALHGRSQETWNATLYSVIYCTSGPALLDYDDNGNPRIILNFNMLRRSA